MTDKKETMFNRLVTKDKVKDLHKQLKRKEQECEELKEANNTLVVTRDKLLGDLFIEEESLKDYIEHYNKAIDELDQLKVELEQEKALKETYFTCYKAKHGDITGKLSKLQNKLDLIKIEILDSICTNCSCDCDIYDICLSSRINKILKDNK